MLSTEREARKVLSFRDLASHQPGRKKLSTIPFDLWITFLDLSVVVVTWGEASMVPDAPARVFWQKVAAHF
jgi:hypothetical protein